MAVNRGQARGTPDRMPRFKDLPMPAVGWYYAKGSKQFGPVSPAELRQLAEKGNLSGDDPVWRDGMDDWVPARKVKGLFDADAKAAETSPAKGIEATPTRAAEAAVKTVEASPVKGTEEPLNNAEPIEVTPAGAISPDIAGIEAWKMPGTGAASATFERSPAAFERSLEGDSYHLFDHLLAAVRHRFTARFVEATARLFNACGHYGLYAATVILLAYHGILAAKTGRASGLFWGAAEAVVLVLLQYTAIRLSGALERLVRTVSGRVVSTVFLDCFALSSMIGGLVALVALTLLAVARLDFFWIVPGVATFILGQYLASVALNPETLNLTITSEGDPGDEAIGIVAFLSKLLLRLVPVGLGVGVASGVVLFVSALAALVLSDAASGVLPPELKPQVRAEQAAKIPRAISGGLPGRPTRR